MANKFDQRVWDRHGKMVPEYSLQKNGDGPQLIFILIVIVVAFFHKDLWRIIKGAGAWLAWF